VPPLDWIRERALRFANESLPAEPVVWDDTTNFMSIERGHLIRLPNRLFLVRSNEHEGRFGIDEQPKFWVKHAVDLATGRMHILKLACEEQFNVHVGAREIRCFRSAVKEARVLQLVEGDPRFMQGRSEPDSHGNLVRIIDFISGPDLLSYLQSIRLQHEQYFHAAVPGVLQKVAQAFEGIQRLHDAGLCHGDIRNDHLLVERQTGSYKWIDFDLNEDSPLFDVWSAGNILHCVVAKGFVTFHGAVQAAPEMASTLWREDASVFFPYRVMNLRKIYPYVPEKLNEVLCRFSVGCAAPYESMSQVAADVADCAASMGA
jgi:serine/threonine protein kinase